MAYYVYMLASGRCGTLYIGMTNNLVRRVHEHRTHVVESFTDRYDVTRLVWYEQHATAESAIKREKAMKRYKRDWKMDLIEEDNPEWLDLFPSIL